MCVCDVSHSILDGEEREKENRISGGLPFISSLLTCMSKETAATLVLLYEANREYLFLPALSSTFPSTHTASWSPGHFARALPSCLTTTATALPGYFASYSTRWALGSHSAARHLTVGVTVTPFECLTGFRFTRPTNFPRPSGLPSKSSCCLVGSNEGSILSMVATRSLEEAGAAAGSLRPDEGAGLLPLPGGFRPLAFCLGGSFLSTSLPRDSSLSLFSLCVPRSFLPWISLAA